MLLFSSDFPHVEGGRNPLKRFDDSLAGLPPRAVERFYTDNFIDLMGEGLAADLRRPETVQAGPTAAADQHRRPVGRARRRHLPGGGGRRRAGLALPGDPLAADGGDLPAAA
jgi:hypothetical protein